MSDAKRYQKPLKAAGYFSAQVRRNGKNVREWAPAGYEGRELKRLLSMTSPFSLSASDANRYKKPLKAAGYFPAQVRRNGTTVREWHPPA